MASMQSILLESDIEVTRTLVERMWVLFRKDFGDDKIDNTLATGIAYSNVCQNIYQLKFLLLMAVIGCVPSLHREARSLSEDKDMFDYLIQDIKTDLTKRITGTASLEQLPIGVTIESFVIDTIASFSHTT